MSSVVPLVGGVADDLVSRVRFLSRFVDDTATHSARGAQAPEGFGSRDLSEATLHIQDVLHRLDELPPAHMAVVKPVRDALDEGLSILERRDAMLHGRAARPRHVHATLKDVKFRLDPALSSPTWQALERQAIRHRVDSLRSLSHRIDALHEAPEALRSYIAIGRRQGRGDVSPAADVAALRGHADALASGATTRLDPPIQLGPVRSSLGEWVPETTWQEWRDYLKTRPERYGPGGTHRTTHS